MNRKYIKKKVYYFLEKTILKYSKRQRFVFTTLVLSGVLITTQLLPSSQIFSALFILIILTYLFGIWCLWEELKGIEFLTLLLPLVLYTGGIELFYFLLPLRWITRLPIAVFYAVGIYALLLTENIYNVAAIRTIALLRAARAVSLLFTLITIFFLLSTLFSFHLPSYLNFIVVVIIGCLAFLPSFWGERLTENIEKNVLVMSITLAFIIGEVAFILSFWPLKSSFEALYMTSLFYTLLSVGENKLKEMPIKKTIWEYIVLNLLALGMLFKTANWKI